MRVADPVQTHSWRGELALEYEQRGERTVLSKRRHDGPLVVQKPLYPEGDAVCHTILLHPPGGIAGGDELYVDVNAGARAHVLLTTPAAGKWYRSPGAWACQRVRVDAAPRSVVEWLAQETIVFDGARPDMSVEVDLHADAVFMGWEILCLGRTGAGERYTTGECRLHTRISREGKPIWFERGCIPAGGLFATSPAGLGGRTVWGTLVAAAPAVNRELVDACRGEKPREGRGAVTHTPGVLIARFMGESSQAARQYFQAVWHHARLALTGRPAHPPRIWST